MAPLIIIGTGLSGYNLAKEFRKHDQKTPLIMITSNAGESYSKPMLSSCFSKNKKAEGLVMATAKTMTESLNATILTNTTVSAINVEGKYITSTQGRFDYSKLVLAWGAEVFQPPIKGEDQQGICTINDLNDYAKFRQLAEGKKHITIIGAGLIGCEFANDLSNGGFQVDVIDPVTRPLQTLIHERSSILLKTALEKLGVTFHFGLTAKQIRKTSQAYELTLSNDETIKTDLVISAVGLRPRISLAKKAGLKVNRGIVTDKYLKTSASNIYALGDCAEVSGHVLLYVLPLMAAARSLAKTLSGNDTIVQYPAMPVMIKTPACPLVTAPPPNDCEGKWDVLEDENNVVAKFFDKDGALRGFSLAGQKACKEKIKLQRQLPNIL